VRLAFSGTGDGAAAVAFTQARTRLTVKTVAVCIGKDGKEFGQTASNIVVDVLSKE
jgi:hypothetical protein